MRARIFNIVQFHQNPKTGEDFDFNEEKAIERLKSKKSFTEWAVITHTLDTYSIEDEDRHIASLTKLFKRQSAGEESSIELVDYIKANQYIFANAPKPIHTHIVIRTTSAIDTKTVADWLGIPEQMIDVPKGRGAFADCLFYLCHESEKEQAKGKHVYERSLVKANFIWEETVNQSKAMLSEYGTELSVRDFLRTKVRYEGYTIDRLIKEYPMYKIDIMNDEQILKGCRKDYIKSLPVPNYRLNFYVEGPGGIGKGIACRALAHSFFPELTDEECFFEVGGGRATFEGYDGQPVIIWNDFRAADFITRFGRGETFDLFDSHPTAALRNIKYGSVKLSNSIHIVNGIEDYNEFLSGLAGEYTSSIGVRMLAEDKGQAYRRFPIILCLREQDYDVLLNKGVAIGTREYEQYVQYAKVTGSFKQVAERLSGQAKEVTLLNMTKPPRDAAKIIDSAHSKYIEDEAHIPEDMQDYGQVTGQLTLDDITYGDDPEYQAFKKHLERTDPADLHNPD